MSGCMSDVMIPQVGLKLRGMLTLVSHILAQLSRAQVTRRESSGLQDRFPTDESSCRKTVATPKSGTCHTTTSDLEPQAANRSPLCENCICQTSPSRSVRVTATSDGKLALSQR